MSASNHIILNDGETEACRLEGNAYTLSSNPLVRIIMFFVKILAFLLGFISKVTVVTTSERVVILNTQKMLWIFNQSVSATTIFPRGINKIGYKMQRSFIFFKTHYLSVTCGSETELFSSKKGKSGVDDMIKEMKNLRQKTI